MRRPGANQHTREWTASLALGAALSQSMKLERTDLAVLDRLPFVSRAFPRESAILQVGDCPPDLYVVISGVAARVTSTRAGEREILALLMPGDVFDWTYHRLNARLGPAERATLDHGVVAVGGCVVGMVRFQVLRKALEDFPPLVEAFERRAIREQAVAREWLVNIGARRASVRLGHLICEIYARFQAMGMTDGATCPLPITQVHLAEALGLSSVHVNRELQSLRAEGLLKLGAGVLELPDLARLQRLSEFSGLYLTCGRARRWAPAPELGSGRDNLSL
jgi:CRP-like cAMP-binding protein